MAPVKMSTLLSCLGRSSWSLEFEKLDLGSLPTSADLGGGKYHADNLLELSFFTVVGELWKTYFCENLKGETIFHCYKFWYKTCIGR